MGLSFLQSPGAAWEIYKQLIRFEQNEEESRKIQVASLCLLLTFVDRPERGKLFLRFFVRSYFLVRTKATNFLLSILLRSSTCQLVSRSLLSFFLVFITTMSSKKFFKNGADPVTVPLTPSRQMDKESALALWKKNMKSWRTTDRRRGARPIYPRAANGELVDTKERMRRITARLDAEAEDTEEQLSNRTVGKRRG